MFRIVVALFCLLAAAAQAQGVPARYTRPVRNVAPTLFDVPTPQGGMKFPVYASADWSQPMPELRRAVLIFHGLRRDADAYFAAGLESRDKAGAAGQGVLVLAPQFLADVDIPAHNLPANTLGWNYDHWAGGEPATTPAPISGFTAIDAILARLADRRAFPKLESVVLAGFSAGGQVVQRYAVVGNGEQALTARGVAVSYVVSDPSSYLYFTPDRPRHRAGCADENAWRYGFGAGVPPYVTMTPADLEARYAHRRVTYLIGLADIDPNHPVLDKSCAGEAQGPQRLARAEAYWQTMQARHGGDLAQRFVAVPGIAHEGQKMFNSPCGQALLFGSHTCPALEK
jgi:hypothetical protein